MTDKYTVSFRMVDSEGRFYPDPNNLEIIGESKMGHMWFSLQKNSEDTISFGFNSGG